MAPKNRIRVLFAVIAVLLGGCMAPGGPVAIEGRVTIIGPAAAEPPYLQAPIQFGTATTLVRDDDGVPALHVTAGADGAAIGSRLDTPLLAMPYLSWGWLRGVGNGRDTALRIRVGLTGGDVRRRPAGGPAWLAALMDEVPRAERYVDLVWQSGSRAIGTWFESGGIPGLVLRTSPGSGSAWHVETVDLAAIHAQLWPRSPLGQVAVTSVFMIVEPRESASIAELVISR
jgi:hypothetical protein